MLLDPQPELHDKGLGGLGDARDYSIVYTAQPLAGPSSPQPFFLLLWGLVLGAQGSSRNTLPYQASLFWLLLAGRARPPFILPFMGTSAKKPTQIYDPPIPPRIFPPPVVQPVLYLHKSMYLVCLVMDDNSSV